MAAEKIGCRLGLQEMANTWQYMICNVKEKRTAERHKGVICKIPCQHCQECYIGETFRHWGIRKAEHQGCVRRREADKIRVANHAISMLHNPDWQNSCVVAKESRIYKRRMMESILIQARTGGDDDMPGYQERRQQLPP